MAVARACHRLETPVALASFDGPDSTCRLPELADSFGSPPPIGAAWQLESPVWYLQRQRTRPVLDAGSVLSSDTFPGALEASPTKSKVKSTILEMLRGPDESGRTAVNGRKLAATEAREKHIATHQRDDPRRMRVSDKVIYRPSEVENAVRQMGVS